MLTDAFLCYSQNLTYGVNTKIPRQGHPLATVGLCTRYIGQYSEAREVNETNKSKEKTFLLHR